MEFPNPANASTLPPILRIPPELRLQIYTLATTTHWDTYPRIYSGFVCNLLEPPFLRVCRTFRLEGLKPYFDFLKDKETDLLSLTMRIQGREWDLRELAKRCDGESEEIGWLVMNRLWIERDLLPDVQRQLKRLRYFGIGTDDGDATEATVSTH